MFDYGHANENQRKAISQADGPVLLIAGPGTGKTFTLVQRAIYLIQERGVAPEQILMATFTEKAAKEIITRITNELDKRNISVNINEMYIGTFHSICLRLLKENIEHSRLKCNYRVLDQFDQTYTIYQNIHSLRKIDGFELVFDRNWWKASEEANNLTSKLLEEIVLPSELKKDTDPAIQAIGSVIEAYKQILDDNNLIDFSTIQTEAFYLLKNNPSILAQLHEKIKYIMIDEYQDTNYIQEQIVFMLGGEAKNICVVGDDDQGLYRFRGATIRNILEFPKKFDTCEVVHLDINYRSDAGIVEFYNDWMDTTEGVKWGFDWDNFRYDKQIKPVEASELKSNTVLRLSSEIDTQDWYAEVFRFINNLKDSGKLTNYNQIAFLFSSVKNKDVLGLAGFLEENGVNVYSPRSNMFFDRQEIKLAIGCILAMFNNYVADLSAYKPKEDREEGEEIKFRWLDKDDVDYFLSCIQLASVELQKPENDGLKKFLFRKNKEHQTLKENADYAFSALFYQLMEFEPFAGIVGTDIASGVINTRPAHNLAIFTQILSKFEYLHRLNVFTVDWIDKNVEQFFNTYIRLMRQTGVPEYEDDSEYAPSGCVSFLTIHQSKGMEFPVVVVGSLGATPRKDYKDFLVDLEAKYFDRPAYEPYDEIKYFDFWRKYYTAFSRAQNLLVLTAAHNSRTPSKYFKGVYEALSSVFDTDKFDIEEFELETVKDVNIKDKFSFTSHITVYETCSIQYKLYKELEFSPVRQNAQLFGQVVHQTIEDIHKIVLRGEPQAVTKENIDNWFESNYTTLAKAERSYLAEPQKNAALKQVQRYAERAEKNGTWHRLKEAEVDVSLVKPSYIIEGKIDLIQGDTVGCVETVEIIDFKSEKKPDIHKDAERLEQYRRQLQMYAHLVEERTGQKVSKMHLYYTGAEDENPQITYPYTKTAIEGTVKAFDDTVQKIMKKEYTRTAKQTDRTGKTCNSCDFRHYCGR